MLGCAPARTWGWALAGRRGRRHPALPRLPAARGARAARAATRSTATASGLSATPGSRRGPSPATSSSCCWRRWPTAFGASGSGVVPAVGDSRPARLELAGDDRPGRLDGALLVFRPAGPSTSRRRGRAARTTSGSRSRSRCLRGRGRPAGHAARPGTPNAPAAGLHGRRLRCVHSRRREAARVGRDARIGPGQRHLHRPLDHLPDDPRPRGSDPLVRRRAGHSPTPSPERRPAAVLLGADGMLAGGPVNGARRRGQVRRRHPRRARRGATCRSPRRSTRSSTTTTTLPRPRHGADDHEPGHGHEDHDHGARAGATTEDHGTTTSTSGTRDPPAGRGAGPRRSRRRLTACRRPLPADRWSGPSAERADLTVIVPNTPATRSASQAAERT